MKASRGDHGLALYPNASLKRLSNIFHVEGINCAGPIAPPYPPAPAIGQDTIVLSGLSTNLLVISRKGCKSRVGFIRLVHILPVAIVTPYPACGPLISVK